MSKAMNPIFKVLLCICALSVSGAGAAYAGQKEDQIAEDSGMSAFFEKDYGKAFRLLLSIAERDFPQAQLYLGFMYIDGKGVTKDYEKGEYYYKKSADQGYSHAQQVLGSCLVKGPCFHRDVVRGLDLMEAAARNGMDTALLELAFMYKRGEGVPKDYVLALKWFNLAAASFEGWATYRDDMEEEMASAQIAEAQKLSREWKPNK